MISSVNMELLPMKGHFFFYNAATGPVIPFLPTLARQLGFSGTIVGIIYTVLPIAGMLAKPLMGAAADRFHSKKKLFLLFQVITAVALLAINFIPEIPSDSKVHFACEGDAVIDTGPSNITVDTCITSRIIAEKGNSSSLNCLMDCAMNHPNDWSTVCKYWGGAALQFCTGDMPDRFRFTAVVPVNKILVIQPDMYMRVSSILIDEIATRPICPNITYSLSTMCSMKCNSHSVSNLLGQPPIHENQVMSMYQFWLFFMLATFAWVGMAVVVSIGDAICFEMLGDKPNLYGNQRLWGSIGWGLFSVLAGMMVDFYSEGEVKKNYTSVFYLMLGLMLLDLLISSRLKYSQQKVSASIVRDVGKLLSQPRILVFMVWCAFMGMCTGFIWQFLFWHLEDLATKQGGCDMHNWIKTLEGLVMGIQCLGGELPFFFLSGWILKKIGHVHCMSFVLLGVGVRYVLYSVLVNPWWVLPVELMNGITFGLFYATMASYASIAAPPGTEATIQGLVGAVFEGVGVSLGSLVGGILYDKYGGSMTFRIFGVASLVCCLIHFGVQNLILKKSDNTEDFDTATLTRYAPPREALRILEDDQQALALVDN